MSGDPLAGLRAEAKKTIDALAETTRRFWITPGEGQMGVYLLKLASAQRYLAAVAAGDPTPEASYPFLAAEVGITGATMQEVATVIVATAAAWEPVAAQIEGLRLAAKAAVDAAQTAEAIWLAAAVSYPQP